MIFPKDVDISTQERVLEDIPSKKCPSCRRNHKTTSFHRNKSKPDGLQANCKKCVARIKKKKYVSKKTELVLRSEVVGKVNVLALDSFIEIFSEAILDLVDCGKL